ncbi:Uncharacterized protein Fot_10592 [Forsythia ovata]|uniref:Uncharacterized protein n=1 Tax=Forsythia ovata TaxID=205694 RepID=A0ABD1WHN1_9LAMI
MRELEKMLVCGYGGRLVIGCCNMLVEVVYSWVGMEVLLDEEECVDFPFAVQFWRLQISTGKSPTYSKYRVYPSIKRTPRLPQLQPTQQQPKPNFVTPYVTPTIQTPPPTTAGAASTATTTSTSHAPPPTAQPT